MSKRGISPLIATVLLVGFTVALAAVVITWGGRFIQQTQDDVDRSTKLGLSCSKLNFEIVSVACASLQMTVTINSNTDQIIDNVILRLTKNDGSVAVTQNAFSAPPLTGFGTQNAVATVAVGDAYDTIEVIAKVIVEGITETCQAGIEKFKIPASGNSCNPVS